MLTDIVKGVEKILESPPGKSEIQEGRMDPAISSAPYRLYNIGNSKPVKLMDFITAIEKYLGQEGQNEYDTHPARGSSKDLGGCF